MVTERLLLRAETPDDLVLLSALVQDMAILPANIRWQPQHRRLVLLGNRFRWESAARGPDHGGDASRVASALRFDFTRQLQRRRWPAGAMAADAVLPLLSVTFDDEALVLSFGGGAELRLTQEVLDATLEDLAPPHPASAIPLHDD